MKQQTTDLRSPVLNRHQLALCVQLARGPQTLDALQTHFNRSTAQIKRDLHVLDATALGPLMYQPGIQLAKGAELLNGDKIYGLMMHAAREILPQTNLQVLLTVDSGNDYVKSRTLCPFVVLCEQQTAGRGRYGRSWQSAFGAGLYLSALFPLADFQDVGGLSLAVGVMVARFVTKLGLDICLKWPNDLLDKQGKKLGGILIEIQDGYVIAGIGINYVTQDVQALGSSSLCAMARAASRPRIGRNLAAARLLNELLCGLKEFGNVGFQGFYAEWCERDVLVSKKITVHNGQARAGICLGINKQGGLLLRADDGKLHVITGGTLHAA